VYIVAFSKSRLVSGTSFSVSPSHGREFSLTPSDLPMSRDDAGLRGIFYAARVPAGE
jgi:hypothetical protein